MIDGSLNIDEVNDVCETNFDSEDFESIGGLVLGQCNGSPEMNQTIIIDNVEMTIKEIDKNADVVNMGPEDFIVYYKKQLQRKSGYIMEKLFWLEW